MHAFLTVERLGGGTTGRTFSNNNTPSHGIPRRDNYLSFLPTTPTCRRPSLFFVSRSQTQSEFNTRPGWEYLTRVLFYTASPMAVNSMSGKEGIWMLQVFCQA